METLPRVKNQALRHRRVLAMLASCLVATAASGQDSPITRTDRIDLPDMGNSAENYLSDGEEQKYAEAIIMQLRAYDVLVDDPLINDYFRDMGYRLVSASDKPDKPFTFVVINEDRVNAFAAPGGVVALHSGLILRAENESEVAGVLAHEVAHITQLHLYRTLQNSQSMTIPIALGMLAIALAGGGSGQAITGALMSGQAMAMQMQINFTRANEVEADRVGITTLSLAGYDPEGMVTFFDKMGKISRAAGKGPPEFLRTHPISVNRIAEAKNRASNMPKPEPRDQLNFYLAQARMRALLEDKENDAIAWFRDRIDKGEDPELLAADQYGLAIVLQRVREFEEARRLLGRLLDQNPSHLAFQLQMADLDMASDREEEALEALGALYHTFPGNHAIAVQYADALLRERDTQRAETASVIVRQQLLLRNDDPMLYDLYAKAASIAGDEVRASEALAESYFRRGAVTEAMDQLEMLTYKDDLDYYQRARVNARLEEMRIMAGELDQDENQS